MSYHTETAGTVTQHVTEVTVSVLPVGHIERETWGLKVVYRGHAYEPRDDGDRYAVKHLSRCLTADGGWEMEPIPSERDDDFIARTRFGYVEAIRRATEQAPHVRVNGMTAADVLAREATRA